jgi:transcriptional regulator NrdR family protein
MPEHLRAEADDGNDVGLRCWRCGQRELRVVYTRPRNGGILLRRRECRRCGQRFTTWERMPHRFDD